MISLDLVARRYGKLPSELIGAGLNETQAASIDYWTAVVCTKREAKAGG